MNKTTHAFKSVLTTPGEYKTTQPELYALIQQRIPFVDDTRPIIEQFWFNKSDEGALFWLLVSTKMLNKLESLFPNTVKIRKAEVKKILDTQNFE